MSPHELYQRMLLIRTVEDRLFQACKDGQAGDLHFSKGQEAISVGVCAVLNATDHMVTHHRTIAHEIAKGADLYPLLAEVLGKATGINGGRAGEMHISNPSIRHDFSFQLVATCAPVATGIAWAQKYFHKNHEIVALFLGDAASSNGTFHEAMTIAAIQQVPLLVVCENNGRAGNITKEHYLPTPGVGERMAAYGIPWLRIDGTDVVEVQKAAEEAVTRVRNTGKPFFLEIEVERLSSHKIGQGDIRTKEEMERAALRDPLLVTGHRLGIGVLERKTMEERFTRQLDDVWTRIEKDPLPALEVE